jgi:hypothetical protein
MKKLAILCLLLGLEASSVLPALAESDMPKYNQAQTSVIDMYRMSKPKCFKEKKGTIQVPYNLTTEQKDFLTRARFPSQEAYQNYIVLNSINNTMAVCLKKSLDVPGFTRKRTSRTSFIYSSKFTNVTLVNEMDKTVVQGAVIIKVKFLRNGKPVIESMRTA